MSYKKSEEYRAKRRAKYAEKHANDPMTPHRKRMIAFWNKRKSKTECELREEKMERDAYEQAMKDIRAEQVETVEDKKVNMDKKVELLMQRFYNRYTGKATTRVSTHLSLKDQEYYVHRVVEYRNLGEKIDQLDIVADNSLISVYSYKRNVIWQEFYELAQRLATTDKE
jgi:hypothetical protein